MLTTSRKVIILLVFFIVTSLAWVTSQSTCNGTVHVVQQGENLFRLSLNYGVDLNTVAQLNGISDPTEIFAGQSICMPTNGATNPIPSQPIANGNTSQTTTVSLSGDYFVPCQEGVECVPDQTQVHFHQGFNRCVSAKLTSAGLGWVPADPEWCAWTNVITHSWDDVVGLSTTVTVTTEDNSSEPSSDNTTNNANQSVGDNLCFDGNAWGGKCDSDFMWKAGYFYSQFMSGQIPFDDIPDEFMSLSSRVGINTSGSSNNSGSSDNNDDDDDDDSSDDSGDDDSSDDSGDDDSSDDSGDDDSSDDSGDDDSSDDSGDDDSSDDSGDDDSSDDSTVTADDCRSNPSVLPLGSAPSASNNASGLLTLVNWARGYCGGLSSLSLSSQLNTASERHSQDMADRNYFDHTAPDPAPHGSSPGQRAQSAGYGSYSGENIAAGNSGILATFTQWWNSSGHRGNILGNHTQMGYGYAFNSSATYRHYNTQMFGRG